MIRVYILKNHYISNEMPLSIHQRLYFWVENFFENVYNLSCILSIWLYMKGGKKHLPPLTSFKRPHPR